MIIEIFQYDSDFYRQELELRNDILRTPIGMNLFDEDLSEDADAVHVGAFHEGKLAGVLLLYPISADAIGIRQVAVAEESRGKKIGSGMLKFAEEYAVSNNYNSITLHSRKLVVEFYKSLGYKTIGDEFTQVGIPHYEMRKEL